MVRSAFCLFVDGLGLNDNEKKEKKKYMPPHMRKAAESSSSGVDADRSASTSSQSSRPSDSGSLPRTNDGFAPPSGGRFVGSRPFSSTSEAAAAPAGGSGYDRRPAQQEGPASSGFSNRGQSSGPYRPKGTTGRPGGFSERDAALETELFGSRINSGINFDKYDEIPVSATGNNTPAPYESFESADFHECIRNVLTLAQYTKPTPIQKYSFSIVEASRDLMACAQTGSGKTGAFLIPLVSKMLKLPREGPAVGHYSNMSGSGRRQAARPKLLVLAPTRELAQQIFDEARKFTYRSWIKPCVIFGGDDPVAQLRSMEKGCDLLVATPGRLTDMIERGRISLGEVHSLVLDEADRMLDMGFEPQIRRIVSDTDMPPVGVRQTLMFSATFPRDIQDLAREFLSNYVFVTVGKVGASSENIRQHIELVTEDEKRSVLLDILKTEGEGLTLIFTETKKNADILDNFLYNQGYACCSIHGDRSQQQRTEALQMFKSGRAPILVATSVASRGLDIPNVTHVINYELPNDMDDYVHRIGRTGRAGNIGKATTFFTEANRGNAKELKKILEDAKQEVPSWLYDMCTAQGPSYGGSFNSSQNQRYRQQSYGRPGGFRGGSSSGSSGYGSSSGGSSNASYASSNSSRSYGDFRGNVSSWD